LIRLIHVINQGIKELDWDVENNIRLLLYAQFGKSFEPVDIEKALRQISIKCNTVSDSDVVIAIIKFKEYFNSLRNKPKFTTAQNSVFEILKQIFMSRI